MKVFHKSLFAIALLTVFLAACNGNGEEEGKDTEDDKQDKEQKTISIGLDPYDYATAPAYISKIVLEQEGYEVNIEQGQVGILFQSLSDGGIDAFVDVWYPNLHSSYLEKYEGEFEMAGTIYSDEMPLGIAVPSYMEDVNTIEDLIENKEEFDNKVYAIDAGSGMALTTKEMLEEYDMKDFSITNSSTSVMVAEAENVIEDKGAIAINAWRPHPMFVNLDIKFLEDPKNVWKGDEVKIGVTPELEEESPTAHQLFSNMNLTLDEVETWLVAMDNEDAKPEELAKAWVKENQDRVDEWLGE